MADKMNNILVKTVKGDALKVMQALVSFCPLKLQTRKMTSTSAMKEAVPLVNGEEWERYLTLPAQQPAPSSIAGRISWWKARLADFPALAPVAIAYLAVPRSSAQAERTFSLLGHKQVAKAGTEHGSHHKGWRSTNLFCSNYHKVLCESHSWIGHLIHSDH